MSKVEMFSKFLAGIVEGGTIGHILPQIAKKYAGHIFTQFPTAASFVGVGVGIGVGICIIDAGLSYGKLGKWMENNQFVKGLSSFALTQITGAVAAMVLTASFTGMIGVAIMVTTIWLAVKATDMIFDAVKAFGNDCIKKAPKEKELFVKYEYLVNHFNRFDDPQRLYNELGIDKIVYRGNKHEFYNNNTKVTIAKKKLNWVARLACRDLLKINTRFIVDGVELFQVKNNRYIEPLQDKVRRFKFRLKVLVNLGKENRKIEGN